MDFHRSLPATACWLRQEIMKAGLLVPFIRTIGGR
jgi:hypothetical protein